MSRRSSLGDRLYRGESGIDFVGRRRTWFIVSGVLILISLAALGFRGLNLGIEFQGERSSPSPTRHVLCPTRETRQRLPLAPM